MTPGTIPLDPDGISLRDLRRAVLIYPESVDNAVLRLRSMHLVERVPDQPLRYRRIADVPCPCDQRGWERGRKRGQYKKAR